MQVGSIVNVQSRTWPGINKPGGTGRIVKVNDNKTINVKYILGGTEKNVEIKFVKGNNMLKTTPRKRKSSYLSPKLKKKEDSTKKKAKASSSSTTLPKQQQISPTTSQNKQQILSDAPSPGSSFLSNTTTTKNEKSANNGTLVTNSDGASTKSTNFSNTTNTKISTTTNENFPYRLKEMVVVQSRTWPGINKPGGVGQVMKINPEAGTVNVKYVLGGSEKNIELKYVTSNDLNSKKKEKPSRQIFFMIKLQNLYHRQND